jgi:hypothetical protein
MRGGEGRRGLVSAVLAGSLALATCGPAAERREGREATGWWVERYVPEGPRHLWLGVTPGGDAEALGLAPGAVTEVRAGHLDAETARALTAAAERALAAPERPLPPGRIPEGEILRLGGSLGGRRVARSWRPAVPGAEAARALGEAVEAAVARLERVERRGRYLRAEGVDPARAALLRGEGRFPFRTRAEAGRLAALAQALADPGRFVAVPGGEETDLGQMLGSGQQLFVDDGDTFEVTALPVTGR